MTVVNRCGKLKLNFTSSEFQNLSFRILRRNFLLLSQFQPIFVLFVAISAVLDPCLKAMSLVGNPGGGLPYETDGDARRKF